MANVKDFVNGAKKQVFRAGAMQVFDLRNALSNAFVKQGVEFPVGTPRTTEPTRG